MKTQILISERNDGEGGGYSASAKIVVAPEHLPPGQTESKSMEMIFIGKTKVDALAGLLVEAALLQRDFVAQFEDIQRSIKDTMVNMLAFEKE